MTKHDLVIIGGGPAGLAAAIGAFDAGIKDIVIIERDHFLGGILNQCIHNGFGLHTFKEELTGPEYAYRFIEKLKDTTVKVLSDCFVLDINDDKEVSYISSSGYEITEAKAIILAMGCRERSAGAISLLGSRKAGIFTAGACQKYCNIDGLLVGKRVVILGSGDIGLIMARRMTLEGAKVLACVELMPYSNGLQRNVVQCLEDYNIPLYLSSTITHVYADERVTGVDICKVDENRAPIKETLIHYDCDTVLLSVGLIPENELSIKAGIKLDPRTNGPIVYENFETTIPGIFACGNVLHVHDLVDNVTKESIESGRAAAQYIMKNSENECQSYDIINGDLCNMAVPQKYRLENVDKYLEVSFRVRKPMKKSVIEVYASDMLIKSFPKPYMNPGEMEIIKIDKNALGCGSNLEIRIREA